MRRHPMPQRVDDLLGREQRGHELGMRLRVLDHSRHGGEFRPRRDVEGPEARIGQRRQDLPRPVGPEIDEEQRIPVRQPRMPRQRDGGDELVRLPRA